MCVGNSPSLVTKNFRVRNVHTHSDLNYVNP